ncbi:MAG TPA: rhomboid family intramembrane serine protease [Candidatus Limnocylindrales bacterium]
MIPLRDANPTRRPPVVTWGLIAACFVVFAYELGLQANGGQDALARFFEDWGVTPRDFLAALGSGHFTSQAALTGLTSQFVHSGWLHILGNMLYLWIFGNNVEDRLGRLPFLAFYLAGGLVAAIAQARIDPTSSIPLVGASGAIAAVLGVYVVLYPGARVLSLVFLGFFYQLAEIPALIVLGFWFVLQLIDASAALGQLQSGVGGVAFFAHIGGFVLGMAVGFVVRLTGGVGRGRVR